jgi:hypothetical protein
MLSIDRNKRNAAIRQDFGKPRMNDDLLFVNLLDLMMQMSDADISVLKSAAGNRDASISTILDSPNYVLWRELTRIGLLNERQSPQIERLENLRVFSITQEGLPRLERLLSEFKNRKGHKRVTEIFETVCAPAGKQIIERVYSAGGDNAEVTLLMGLLLTSVLKVCVSPKDYDRAVQQVSDFAKKRLASMV